MRIAQGFALASCLLIACASESDSTGAEALRKAKGPFAPERTGLYLLDRPLSSEKDSPPLLRLAYAHAGRSVYHAGIATSPNASATFRGVGLQAYGSAIEASYAEVDASAARMHAQILHDIRDRGIRNILLVGYSYGARSAIRVAREVERDLRGRCALQESEARVSLLLIDSVGFGLDERDFPREIPASIRTRFIHGGAGGSQSISSPPQTLEELLRYLREGRDFVVPVEALRGTQVERYATSATLPHASMPSTPEVRRLVDEFLASRGAAFAPPRPGYLEPTFDTPAVSSAESSPPDPASIDCRPSPIGVPLQTRTVGLPQQTVSGSRWTHITETNAGALRVLAQRAAQRPQSQWKTGDVYLSVGAERSFLGAFMTGLEHVVQIDVDRDVRLFNHLNRLLIDSSSSQEEYRSLRWLAAPYDSFEVWRDRLAPKAFDPILLRPETYARWKSAIVVRGSPIEMSNAADSTLGDAQYSYREESWSTIKALASAQRFQAYGLDLNDLPLVESFVSDLEQAWAARKAETNEDLHLGIFDASNVWGVDHARGTIHEWVRIVSRLATSRSLLVLTSYASDGWYYAALDLGSYLRLQAMGGVFQRRTKEQRQDDCVFRFVDYISSAIQVAFKLRSSERRDWAMTRALGPLTCDALFSMRCN